MVKRGKFIVFEGIDCSGKTTAINVLTKSLNQNKINFNVIKFPDREGVNGELIDKYLKKEIKLSDNEAYELFKENRMAYKNYINNQLNDGIDVICDRYIYSGITYSYYNKSSIESPTINDHTIELMNNELYMPTPDLVFLIDGYRPRTNETAEKYENAEINTTIYNIFVDVLSIANINYKKINNRESLKFTANQLLGYYSDLK